MRTDQWLIRVVVATTVDVPDAELDAMADAADERDAAVARRADGPGVAFTLGAGVHARPPAADDAVRWALGVVRAAGSARDAAAVDVRAMIAEVYEAEALRADIPELASAADAAVLLGVSRQRVHQLATAHPRFPRPVARPASGPLWTRDAVERFASTWERKAGRPAAPPRTTGPLPTTATTP